MYFGPYHVKMNKRTRSNSGTAKRYGVLFTCLMTRTVHIELAKDLSTDAFILTLRRFISRRGNAQVMRSDNSTNFVGANNHLIQEKRNIVFIEEDIVLKSFVEI